MYQAILISNNLYESDTLSGLKISKGYTKQIEKNFPPITIPSDLFRAQKTISTKERRNNFSAKIKLKNPVLESVIFLKFTSKEINNRDENYISLIFSVIRS